MGREPYVGQEGLKPVGHASFSVACAPRPHDSDTLTPGRCWPDDDWLSQRDEVFEFPLPPGTIFDGAAVHLMATATLDDLRTLARASRFEIPRFRPNFVIAAGVGGTPTADPSPGAGPPGAPRISL